MAGPSHSDIRWDAVERRVLVTLIHELRRRGLRYGLASLCVGGGMGAATIVEIPQ